MAKHDHTPPKGCKHELKHCTHCDTVYCTKCDIEWSRLNFDILKEIEKKSWPKEQAPFRPRWQDDPNIVLCIANAGQNNHKHHG